MTAHVALPAGSNPPGFLRRQWKKLLLVPLVVCVYLAAPYLALFGRIAGDAIKERLHRRSFDPVVWKRSLADENPDDPVRLRMVDDLLRRHRLIGQNRNDVLTLLGSPPKTQYFGQYDLVYWLGPERGVFSIDSEWLAIHFDGRDHVDKADVVRD